MRFTADFETTTDPNDCRVWAWGLYEIDEHDFYHGTSIHEFFQLLKTLSKSDEKLTVYFHNLKFDGEFILSYLLDCGYIHVDEKKKLEEHSFTTLITEGKVFYSIEVCFDRIGKRRKKVEFLDSLKILPFSVEKIAKDFDVGLEKLDLDYTKKRELDHKLSIEELAYLKNDVEIVARALKILFNQKLTKMTAGSNALHDFKSIYRFDRFKKDYPVLEYDKELRQSYKGGFTYVNPVFQGKELGKGIVLDVNSLYPSVMYDEYLPYDHGKFYQGKYEDDPVFDLYIQMISVQFKLKKDHIPSIQIKHNLRFKESEYLKDSGDEEVILVMTNIDLELMFSQYHVYNIEYLCGWKFKSAQGLFKNYIDKWTQVKVQAAIDGNSSMYTLAKLMLNSLYGKFATNPESRKSIPYIDHQRIVRYSLGEVEERDPVYLPVSSFITAYARKKTILSAQQNYDRFIYADTDSLHLLGTELPTELDIHPTELGKWSHESTFIKAKYLRQKTYMQTTEKGTSVTVAGMTSNIHPYVTYENFTLGTTFTPETINPKSSKKVFVDLDHAKLKPKRVKGGIILEPSYFTLRP